MDNNLIDRIKYLLSHAFSKHGEGSYGLSSFIRKPNRLEIITAFLIFATFLGCLFLWAHMNEDQTLDNRKNRIPSIYASVSVSDKILKVSDIFFLLKFKFNIFAINITLPAAKDAG